MEKYRPGLQEKIKLADNLIGYFHGCLSAGHSFRLGLYIVKQWRKYLVEDQHDLGELRVFLDALEDGALMYGTAWYELTLHVMLWLDELEEGESIDNERRTQTSQEP